jgi:hypothetical protein
MYGYDQLSRVTGLNTMNWCCAYVDDNTRHINGSGTTLKDLQATFKLKDDKIEVPDMYLGAQLGECKSTRLNAGQCPLKI